MESTNPAMLNPLLALVVTGFVLLHSALPAAAGQPISLLTADARSQMDKIGDFTQRRNDYLEKAAVEMHDWRQKMREYHERARAPGQEGDDPAQNELAKAWDTTKSAAGKLRSATIESWPTITSSYERASAALAIAWRDNRPESE